MATPDHAAGDRAALFAGPGANARLLRGYDWSSTPVGAPDTWPTSWRAALRLMLDSAFPVCVLIGVEHFCYFHNNLYIPFTGTKHPGCVGRPCREVWAEVYEDVVKPLLLEVVRGGRPLLREHMRFDLQRQGCLEEGYFTFTYNPLRDADGSVVGIYVTCIESTAAILARRRLECLRKLSARAFTAETPEEACVAAGEVLGLSAVEDCPGALLYLVDHHAREARLVAAPGLSAERLDRMPPRVSIDAGDAREADPLRIAEVVRAKKLMASPDFAAQLGLDRELPAFALPIMDPEGKLVAGVLLGLATPLRPREEVCDFLQLIAGQLSTAIANARAKEYAIERTNMLSALDHAKTTFFSNVSHELRTPLTLLMGPLTQVLTSGKLSEGDRALLELSRRGASRLQKLIKSLLDFSRMEAGRVDARYEAVNLAAFTRDLASMFASAFEVAGVSFIVDAPPLSEPLYVDREMWEKIVLNLLSNALKFTFEGEVRLRLQEKDGEARLSVSDTGCGIAPEHLPHIFDRFYRVETPRARTQEGSGIGLSLVRELAHLHGGSVSTESTPGRGTTMHVHIPRGSAHLPSDRLGLSHHELTGTFAQLFREEGLGWLGTASRDSRPLTPPCAPVSDAVASEEGTKSGACVAKAERSSPLNLAEAPARIVLADDNADMRSYLCRILDERWEVHAVADGSAALRRIQRAHPDLVLADVMMPGLDGFALLSALRANEATAQIPVILVSARAGEEATAHALSAGAADYVVKPFSARELVARVQAQLAQVRLQRAERAARELAEQESRARERFLAVLSHELRSPISAILGWTELLRMGKLSPADAKRAFGVIEQSIGLQRRLIEDLLDVSRIVAGRLTIDKARIESLAPQIEAVVDAFRLSAGDKGVRIEATVDANAGPLMGDAQRLQQVVTNLVGNAVKFTSAGGRVRIVCKCPDGQLTVEVSDTGRGIEPAALPHVFDEFWMGSQSEGRRGGLGLGLAIARSIVTLHGGMLTVTSEGQGRGTTFTVRLPLAVGWSRTLFGEHVGVR